MFKSKYLFWGVILLCLLFSSGASASGPRALSPWEVGEAELIIIGTASNIQLLPAKREIRRVSSNSFTVSPTSDGMICCIKVEEVLLDKRQAEGNGVKKLSDVSAFIPYPRSNVNPYCVSGERYLVFLDPLNIDPKIVERHQLKIKSTYSFVSDSSAAVHRLSSDHEGLLVRQRIKENLQYAEETRTFCNVMKIRDSAERLEQLKGLLKNPWLKENPWFRLGQSVSAEIERIQDPKEYERHYRIWREANEIWRKRGRLKQK